MTYIENVDCCKIKTVRRKGAYLKVSEKEKVLFSCLNLMCHGLGVYHWSKNTKIGLSLF